MSCTPTVNPREKYGKGVASFLKSFDELTVACQSVGDWGALLQQWQIVVRQWWRDYTSWLPTLEAIKSLGDSLTHTAAAYLPVTLTASAAVAAPRPAPDAAPLRRVACRAPGDGGCSCGSRDDPCKGLSCAGPSSWDGGCSCGSPEQSQDTPTGVLALSSGGIAS